VFVVGLLVVGGGGAYVFPAGDDDRSHVPDGVASVPSDYETFRVVFDGRTMATVQNDGSNVILRRLENGTA
jgi:hypothetical protein